MSRHPQNRNVAKVRRVQYGDGGAVVTYPNGSILILESALAKIAVLREAKPVNYDEPPPKRKVEG